MDNIPYNLKLIAADVDQLTQIPQEVANASATNDDNFEESPSLFRVRTATQSLADAASLPDPIELYPKLIIEGETTIAFADTGIGKTVYAVQIGIYISQTHPVLYVDLELSDKQFEKRYTDDLGNHFEFNENFYRADFTPFFSLPREIGYEEFFIESLILAIEKTKASVVIIDNMTKLIAGDSDTAKAAIPMMENLSKLKRDHELTFLLLEHNKKVNSSRPIELNDLQGSKMKSNFADAVFTIGRSVLDPNLRYIKQLKVRSAERFYHEENVLTYELIHENGFLQFREIGYSNEREHFREASEKNLESFNAQVLELHQKGFSYRKIGEELKVSHMKVKRIIEKVKQL